MKWIKRKNFFILDKNSYYNTDNKNIKKVVDILNKDRLIIIKWIKNIWKINFIKEFIEKTKISKNYFYFNKSKDVENNISVSQDLENLLNEYIKLYKIPKIIILQDISKIDWIKNFIWKIYKEKYKIILIWNTIKIWWIKEIEIFANIELNIENLETSLKYWTINEIVNINFDELKEKYLNLITSDIILNNIVINYWIKNLYLYNLTITYLSYYNNFISLRELHKKLDNIQNISLKTVIDYIDFSLQEKIIKKMNIYNLKTNKKIKSKVKYYFSNNWIRNSLSNFELTKDILVENLIYNILEKNDYKIYWGLNWNFEFTFFWKNKETKQKIYIHISNKTNEVELKKEVNKFFKIKDEYIKYILVEDIEKLKLSERKFGSVKILEIDDFLINYK